MLVEGSGLYRNPSWRPGGRHIVFTSDRGGSRDLYVVGTSSGRVARLSETPRREIDPDSSWGNGDIALVEDRKEGSDLLVLEPEFARVLRVMARQGNTLSAVLRQGWESGRLRIMTKNSPAQATGAHISLIAHITVEELQRELTDTESVNGFANRFGWLLVRRSKFLPEPLPFEGEGVREVADRLAGCLDHARKVGEIRRTPEARALWARVYRDLSDARPGLAGAILARGEAIVLRLSALYALLDQRQEVDVAHLQAALELWAYCERSVDFIFGDAVGDPIADTIYRALTQNGAMSRTQISELLGRHVSADRIAHALQTLVTAARARSYERETGGRPVEMWEAT